VVPAVEATAAIGWCGLTWLACRDGAFVGEHAAVMERKAGGRRSREREACESRGGAGHGADSR